LSVGTASVPQHVAIIMDGNGRWAQSRGLPRVAGHRAGALAIRPVLECAAELGIKVLTLYSFSSENWSRPAAEVDALMALCVEKLVDERDGLVKAGVRLKRVGLREGLPERVLAELDATEQATAACSRITLALALNYGARAEIVAAARGLAAGVARGDLSVGCIDETAISSALCTRGLPDPDLLIRTAGQQRLSNFLLWQLSYAELLFLDVLWPDFSPEHLREAAAEFAARRRTFGGIRGISGVQSEPTPVSARTV
jgi:undecaprenyl diphosphate synthase